MDQQRKKEPARKRPLPGKKPSDQPNDGRDNPFPDRQPREIPLSDPPGDVVGDPQGDVIGDPQVDEPRSQTR
jgi:hypothetical protein